MSRIENVELTVLCLIEDGDKILLQNRVKKDWQGYALPGGHVESGESFVDAVIREMKEETGLTIIEPRMVGVKQFPIEDGRYIVLLFKATQWSGDLVSSEEGQMEWIKYSDLPAVKTVDDFDDLLRVMNTPELTEFQYLVSGDEWTVAIKYIPVCRDESWIYPPPRRLSPSRAFRLLPRSGEGTLRELQRCFHLMRRDACASSERNCRYCRFVV